MKHLPNHGCSTQAADGSPQLYAVSWVFTPNYIVNNLKHFPPVDAVDAGHFKATGSGVLH
eukprot:815151-Pleurochrysis_carterae.AAC.1